jgi:hypothetical protein
MRSVEMTHPPTVPPCPATARAAAFLTIPRGAGEPHTAALQRSSHRRAAKPMRLKRAILNLVLMVLLTVRRHGSL